MATAAEGFITPQNEFLIEEVHRSVLACKSKAAEEAREPSRHVRVVVLCVDESEYGKHCLQWYTEHGATKDDILILVNVWEELTLERFLFLVGHHHGYPFSMVPDTFMANISQRDVAMQNRKNMTKSNELLAKLGSELLKDHPHWYPLPLSCQSMSTSYIGETVCRTAEMIRADQVCVGCRGMGAFKRWFLGSVSKYVVEHAKCPVLVVKD